MLLGLGRGPPGRGPPLRARSVGPVRPTGRGPPGPAGPAGACPGAGRGVAPMPVAVELKGLLPGRGPGRGADRWPGVVGAPDRAPAPPGRGADGLGPGMVSRAAGWAGLVCAGLAEPAPPCAWPLSAWALSAWPPWAGPLPRANGSLGKGAGGACGSCATAGCGEGCGGCGAGLASAGSGRAGACTSGTAAARPFAARRSGAVATAAAPSPVAFARAANSSFSRRTTGASIVEDADRTNSPISWSLAITALLSTPNSFASSYTRTFATALPLLGPGIPGLPADRGRACSVRRQFVLFIAACSSGTHHKSAFFRPVSSAVDTIR
jgi:hypothetical protein